MTQQAHVSDDKKKNVAELVKLFEEYPISAAVNMENLPAPQLQNMRAQLREKVVLKMAKRRLIKIVIDKAKEKVKGIEKLEQYLLGMPALLFTKDNPFTLYKIIKKNKSKAPAKAGQTAPNDIVVSAGPTSFSPGPIIGELGALGLQAGVENGKVVVKEDKVVVKSGEIIQPKVAELLGRLGIKPMEVGLNLVAALENGDILTRDILDIDEDKYLADIAQAAQWAFNLSAEAGYVTDDNKELLLQKAFREAKALALEANILADAVVGELVEKAESQMNALKSQLNIEVPKKEEKSAEEKKEDVKEETTDTAEKPAEKQEESKPEEKKAEPVEEVKEDKKEEPKQEEPAEKPVEPAKEENKTE